MSNKLAASASIDMEGNFVDTGLKPKKNWGTGLIVEKARYYDPLASSEHHWAQWQHTTIDFGRPGKRRKNRNDFAYISSQANLPET